MEYSWEFGSVGNMEGNIGTVLTLYNSIRAVCNREASILSGGCKIVRLHDIKNPWHNPFVHVRFSVIVNYIDNLR